MLGEGHVSVLQSEMITRHSGTEACSQSANLELATEQNDLWSLG